MATPRVQYTFANMATPLPSSSAAAAGSSEFDKPAKKHRRRGRRGGKKKQAEMQKAQHKELVDRLDQIRDILQVAVGEMVEARRDRHDSRTVTPDARRFEAPLTPSTTDYNSSTYAVDLNPNMMMKLAESFFILEMELNITRDRLRDLRAVLGQTNDERVRDGILDVVNTLENSIEQDLARLCIITQQQYDAGLSDFVPATDPRPNWSRGSEERHFEPFAEPRGPEKSATTSDASHSDADRSIGVWEWVYPELEGLARPLRRA